MIVRDGDFAYTDGPTSLYASPWGATKDEIGKYYQSSIEDTGGNTTVRWVAPVDPSTTAGVYGYTYKALGNYWGNTPKVPLVPRKVQDVKTMTVATTWSAMTILADWNLLVETHLRNDPKNMSDIALEVAMFPHVSQSMWAFAKAKGKPVGTFDGTTVTILPGPGDKYKMAAFLPSSDRPTVRLDFVSGFAFLKSKGLITGNEYVTGVAAGVEPVVGAGVVTMKSLAFNLT